MKYIYRRITSLFLILTLIFTMTPMVFADGEAYSVVLNKTTLSMAIDEQDRLTAVVKKTADNSVVAGASVAFFSTDPLKVYVNPTTGDIKGLAACTDVVIRAQYTDPMDGETCVGECNVSVTAAAQAQAASEVPVTGIELSPRSLDPMEVGGKPLILTAHVTPENPSNKILKWVSKDPSVVTISATQSNNHKAEITAVGPGSTVVYAESADGVKSNEVMVTVSGLTLTPSLELLAGRSETLVLGRYGMAEGYTVEWKSSNVSVAVVKAEKISAYNPGTTVIKATAGKYTATCNVTVKEDVADAIQKSMKTGEALSFSSSSIVQSIQSMARERLEAELEYITGLSVSTKQGILHHGYKSPDIPGSGVGSSERYYLNAASDQRDIDDVFFVPASDFGETAVIHYTGCADGRSFTGTIRVAVENSGDVAYNTAEGRLLPFEIDDFISVTKQKTGRALRYVTFKLPAVSKGILYYNYSSTGQFSQRVSESSSYYVSGGSLLLENVSFLPAEGYTGDVEIPYYATDTSGTTTNGTISIKVFGVGGEQGSAPDIVYQVSAGYPVQFDEDDFDDVCREVLDTGINYIYLKKPDPSQGTLLYNADKNYENTVSENIRYFEDESPYISDLFFVTDENATGTVTLGYTGYGNNGERFEGKILIQVTGGVGEIQYSTRKNRYVEFDGLDFNEACLNENGAGLNAVRFALPSSGEGVLYSSYSTKTGRGTEASESRSYTVSSISNMVFVPKRGYTGTVSIPFSGRDENGGYFHGTVEIVVESTISWNDTIHYSGLSGGMVAFKTEDFNEICTMETGDPMDYVRFTLPDPLSGILREGSRNGRTISENDNYYRAGSAAQLDEVVFVVENRFTGEILIPYTGRSIGGDSFQGTVEITITAPISSKVDYTGSSLPIAFKAQSFRDACVGLLPSALAYVQFDSVPSEIYGVLMQNYSKPNGGSKVVAGSKFYNSGSPAIDGLAFVPKMGYEGTVTIPYTAADISGNVIEGTLKITISNRYLPSSFTDTGNYGWANPSIEFLRDSGVINGYGNGKYGPADSTSKGAFVLMVCRLFGLPQQMGENFKDVPANNPYAREVLTARVLGIADGETKEDGVYFYPNAAITRQQAITMLVKVMQAAGREIPYASSALLSIYNDGDQVADYAKGAMTSMIKMGVITGDPEGNLNPGSSITRAEMAVILHKVLTM